MVSKRTSRNVRLKVRFAPSSCCRGFVNARRASSKVEDEVIQLKHGLEETQRLLHENVVEEYPHASGVGQSNGVQGRQQIAASNTESCGCSTSVLPGSAGRGIVTLGQIYQLG